MYTLKNNLGLPSFPLARMLTSILPFLAAATPTVLLATTDPGSEVSNTASVSVPAGATDIDTANNSVIDQTARFALISAVPDVIQGVDGANGAAGVLNALAGDTLDGVPATPSNALLSLAVGSSIPPGISFDTVTGDVDVAPGTPTGDYSFEYRICQASIPDNCAVATATIGITSSFSEISGTVFLDSDGDQELDGSETRLGGWVVELSTADTPTRSATTDDKGTYVFSGLAGGVEYTITFRDPETGVVYERIEGVLLEQASTLPDQNLPINPSGIIYDSITRLPVPGATVTLVDANGVPLPEICYLDPSQRDQMTGRLGIYRVDVVPGAAAACPTGETLYTVRISPPVGYSFTSTILPPQAEPLDPTGLVSPVKVASASNARMGSDPVYYVAFELQEGDPDIINNHLPLDPFLSRDRLIVTKTSTRRSASTGDLVPYEITVRNPETFRRADVDVIDVLPAGMSYVAGSARVDGKASEPRYDNGNRELVWPGQVIPADGSVTYELMLVVGAGIAEGQAVNTGVAENGIDGREISNRGTATVTIVPSTVFDCSELVGQVFEDRNGNGYQEAGEPGIPSVRLATVNGELVTTDEYGRYHIACAAIPDPAIGSNFILRLDEETLASGWSVTTDNPRSIRLTRGKMGELNFGVAEVAIVTLTLDGEAFVGDGSLKPDVFAGLEAPEAPRGENLVIRADYAIARGEDHDLIAARLVTIRDGLRSFLARNWIGREPSIEVNASSAASEGGEE